MEIEAFLLCDAATDQQGKLNVLGTFESIFAKEVPVIHPSCAVATRIRFENIEEGEHSVKIDVIDEDGKQIIPRLEGKIAVKFESGTSTGVNLILNLNQLKFEKFGEYSVKLAIDGQAVRSLPLRLAEVPKNLMYNRTT